MNSFNKYFFFVLLLTLCLSCEEDYVLLKDEFKASVVVNAIFKDKSPWIINLTFSKDIFSKADSFSPIENAEVIIIEKSNGREILLKHVGKGKYVSEIFPPEPDKTYKLKVLVPGYEEVTAVSNAPKRATLKNVISELINQDVTKINFEIDNNENSYYIWNIIASNKKNPIDSSFSGNANSFINGVIKYNDIAQYIKTALEGEKNDAISGGGKFSASLVNPDIVEGPSAEPDQDVTKKFLRLLTTSKDLYNYYKTVEKFVSANNHNSSFTYAPEIYSNIKNGLGIFAGYTEEYKEVK